MFVDEKERRWRWWCCWCYIIRMMFSISTLLIHHPLCYGHTRCARAHLDIHTQTHTAEDKSVVRNVTNLRKRWGPTTPTTPATATPEKNDNEKNRPKRNEKWRWSEMMTAIKLRVSRMDCSRIMSARESLVYFWGLGPYQVWYYNTSKCLWIHIYMNMIQWMNEWMDECVSTYIFM